MTDRPVTPAARTAASDERARKGRKEVRLQILPEIAAAVEKRAKAMGRQAFSDALNQIFAAYDAKGRAGR